MVPSLNNNTFENLTFVLMFQDKAFFINARLRFSNVLLFKYAPFMEWVYGLTWESGLWN